MNRLLIRRTTAITDALVAACAAGGIDTSSARLPRKTEPTWTVTRRPKRRVRK